jgi:mRNA N6-methyladenine demethylase
MGKGKSRGRKNPNHRPETTTRSPPPRIAPHSTLINTASLPLPFPSGYPVPEGRFLRDEGNYKQSFQIATKTSYEGFVVDSSEATNFDHSTIEAALEHLHSSQLFRTDVTQPFGLGTKCAKTYVTRCLLGERGTTYKYLGLRMFGHPWDGLHEEDPRLQKTLQHIRGLNENLTSRTAKHLADLDQARRQRGGEPVKGRAGFDICLINRMEYSTDLKPEPSTGEGRCSVSWHADSSLEHYSSIAVYHTLSCESNKKGKWSVGLRVAHNSEGPQASRRGTDIESSIVTDTPPIAISLPSRSTYYLLDDFNHHHQHVVLAEGEVEGIRYSSTHRLLRDSHNVSYVLERCKNTVGSFHKKGLRVWRSEQLLLTEVESEWIRQFFIQGEKHRSLLWKAWGEPMQQLLKYWSQLEERTVQTTDLLQLAAEGQCRLSISDCPSRQERKLRDKRKKALTTLDELMSRGAENTDIYESLADLLEERGKMRDLWGKREKDHVFTKMDQESRPLPVPFYFESSSSSEPGHSQLIADVHMTASDLRKFGKAFATKNAHELPKRPSCKPTSDQSDDPHSQKFAWEGWKTLQFGLEMQDPWAGLLLDGSKTIETRAYNLPPGLIGKRIAILQSSCGQAGISCLGDAIRLDSEVKKLGWVVFERVIEYKDEKSFEDDESKHLVDRNSGYGWKEGTTNVIFGWVVAEQGNYQADHAPVKRAERRMRSLFELMPPNPNKLKEDHQEHSRKRKRGRF